MSNRWENNRQRARGNYITTYYYQLQNVYENITSHFIFSIQKQIVFYILWDLHRELALKKTITHSQIKVKEQCIVWLTNWLQNSFYFLLWYFSHMGSCSRYNINLYSLSNLQKVGDLYRLLRFPVQIKLTATIFKTKF
jgi:hypothetical protein